VILTRIATTVCLSLVSTAVVYAAEPERGIKHRFEKSDHFWQLDHAPSHELLLFESTSNQSFARFDLSGCLFCAGQGDNCESDGIREIVLASIPEEPVLAVVCHVGAHSQRLQIVAPLRSAKDAVFSVTGEYFVTYQPTAQGIIVQYDARNEGGSFGEITSHWP